MPKKDKPSHEPKSPIARLSASASTSATGLWPPFVDWIEMTEHANVNPDAAPRFLHWYSIGSFSLLDTARLALALFGTSLLTLTALGSLAWNGTISIFPLQDQAHLLSLMTSAGLAICALLSQIVGQMTRFRSGYMATFPLHATYGCRAGFCTFHGLVIAAKAVLAAEARAVFILDPTRTVVVVQHP